ncbi:MAG: hypothetical protein K2W96_24885 [Gemmataceae bacterium]|nr:hypothetical protein [Gemmataceae bacterium]
MRPEREYLDEALAGFSGYLAADELYDGPFCVLSVVDARRQRRLLYEVLDHDPTRYDALLFLARANDSIRERGHAVLGITTDASPLYPLPISVLWGGRVTHQVCTFHILKELNRSVLGVVASWRKRLAAQKPKRPRGGPGKGRRARRLRAEAEAIGRRIAGLFEHRHLFVRRRLDASQRALLLGATREDRHLRVLRSIMDEVHRLFDRRCRTETALARLAKLRRRVRRHAGLASALRKLESPNLEKALTFLDDKLLPATSNAVERANRRVRKMQKAVYRVRTRESLKGRLALDLLREGQAESRGETLQALHDERR